MPLERKGVELKNIQTNIPKSIHNDFKSVVYSNGERVNEVLEQLIREYLAKNKK